MALYFEVPNEDIEVVKKLGAAWSEQRNKWYVTDRNNYYQFRKWILNGKNEVMILCDCFYIIEAEHYCFRCHHKNLVIGFGVENHYLVSNFGNNQLLFQSDVIHIASQIKPLPEVLLKFLKDKYHFYKSYSKTIKDSYYANHCAQCNVIQGAFFLFNEVDTPFFVDSKWKAKQLKLYKVTLKNDLIVEADIGYGSTDDLIKKYGQKINFQ